MATALFVCLHNAGCSQMSEALFERAARRRHDARSAGTKPVEQVHPQVVEAMREIRIDLSDRVPRRLADEDARWADVVVTMGCGDEYPYIPGRRYIDWTCRIPATSRVRGLCGRGRCSNVPRTHLLAREVTRPFRQSRKCAGLKAARLQSG